MWPQGRVLWKEYCNRGGLPVPYFILRRYSMRTFIAIAVVVSRQPPCIRSPVTVDHCTIVRHRAIHMAEDAWTDSEDWALADAVPQFTVGRGSDISTFWTALTTTTPELSSRSAGECEARHRALAGSTEAVGKQPSVLEEWERLADGRYTGRLAGEPSFVWLTVAKEGRLVSDPRVNEPGYIEAVGGRVYELSRAKVTATAAAAAVAIPAPAPPSAEPLGGALKLPNQAAAALGAALLAVGLGFGLGSAFAPPPPPPPPPPAVARVTKIIYTQARAPRSLEQGAQPGGDAPARAPALAPAPLTVSEQRERQEQRVSRDRLKIQNLEQVCPFLLPLLLSIWPRGWMSPRVLC